MSKIISTEGDGVEEAYQKEVVEPFKEKESWKQQESYETNAD